MTSQSAVVIQDVDLFTQEQCDKLVSHLKETCDLKGNALVALLAAGYRYNEMVSARVSTVGDEDGYFAEISKSRSSAPILYIFRCLRDWIRFANLSPGDLLFSSKRSRNKPMTAVALKNLVKSWLCIMGCEVVSDTAAVSRFRRKVAAMPRNRIGG